MRKESLKKLKALLITLTLSVPCTPVQAEENETFTFGDFVITGNREAISWNGDNMVIHEANDITIKMKDGVNTSNTSIDLSELKSGKITWENVNVEADKGCPVTLINSNVEFVFPEGTESSFNVDNKAAIVVPKNSKLTISGKGIVNAKTKGNYPGIGSMEFYEKCGEIVIKEGTVNAESSFGAGIGGCTQGYGGTVTIDGGTVNATSFMGSAIGAGYSGDVEDGCAGGTLTINGGTVNVTNTHGTGIGGGWSEDHRGGDGGSVTINDGTLNVKVGSLATGIGGGWSKEGNGGNGGTFTMNGGDVMIETEGGPAIGGGWSLTQGGNGSDVTLNGGTLTAKSSRSYVVIGGGSTTVEENTYGGNGGTLTITGGTLFALIEHPDDKLASVVGSGRGSSNGTQTVITINPKEGTQIKAGRGYSDSTYDIDGSPFTSETVLDALDTFVCFCTSASNVEENTTDEVTTAESTTAEVTTAEASIKAPETKQEQTTSKMVQPTKGSNVVAPKAVKLNKLKYKKKRIVATWKTKESVNGYEVQYSTNKKFKKNVNKKILSSASYKIKAKKGKTYYVRVRAFRKKGSKRISGAWSSVKKIKIKK